jgi:hypothetical protein
MVAKYSLCYPIPKGYCTAIPELQFRVSFLFDGDESGGDVLKGPWILGRLVF